MLLKFFCFRSNKVRQLVDSFKNERNELMAIWPDIVSELTKDNNEELLDVNKWITEVSIFFKLYIIN